MLSKLIFNSYLGKKVSRGCVKDLTPEIYSKCRNSENCEICLNDNCNVKEVKSAAAIHYISIPILILGILYSRLN